MSYLRPPFFRFDDFYLDRDRQRVTYKEEFVPLTPKAFQTLVLLLENHGRVVEKDFFLSEIWADTFVEESTLAQNILTLRKTLRRFAGDKDYIVTIPRRGYEFVGSVESLFPDPEIKENKLETTGETLIKHAEAGVVDPGLGKRADGPMRESVLPWLSPVTTGVALSLAIALAAAIAYSAIFSNTQISLAESQFKTFRVDPMVADADIRNAVISPNGKYLALIQLKNGVQSLYVRQTESGNTSEVVPQINGRFIGATFSPSSEEIYYSVEETSGSSAGRATTLYSVSVVGGAARKILHDISSPPAISPNATQLAFTRGHSRSPDAALVISDIDGRNERRILTPGSDSEFTNRAVSWSPDGKLISTTVIRRSGTDSKARVVIVDVKTEQQTTVANENWVSAGDTIWMADGSGIFTVAFAATSPTLNDELWLISYPAGTARLVTKGIKGEYGISLNKATNSVVAVQSNKFACFLTASVDDLYKNTHVLTTVSDRGPLPFGADWTNDGRIVYSSAEGGNADIFAISEGGEQKQLTSDAAAEISPKISADGRLLIFMSNRSGQMEVWRSDANGTNALQLTKNGNVTDSIISPDGGSVYYLVKDPDSKVERLWRVSITGENAAMVTDIATRSPRISPDGATIAAYVSNPKTNSMMLGLISTRTGEVTKHIATPSNDDIPFLDWSKDGQDLFVVMRRGKPVSLWRVPLSGKSPTQLREWENDAIFRLAISRDGERVFYEVGNELNSVVQIQSLDPGS